MSSSIEPITISKRATEEILKIIRSKNIPDDYGLRVGVRGGGCAATLMLGFDRKKEMDKTYVISGINVYIDKRHALYVVGKEIDFYDGADARGFHFADSPASPESRS